MKDTDKIRILLKDAIEYKGDYAYGYIIKKCKTALDLLSCELPEKKDLPCNFLRWCEWQNRNNCGGCVYYLH